MYLLLAGYPPFNGNDDTEIKNAITLMKLDYPIEEWTEISDEGKSLISMLLQKNPKLRINAK